MFRGATNTNVQAFERIGHTINPQWLFKHDISGNTNENPIELEKIWDRVQRKLQKEKQIKAQKPNRTTGQPRHPTRSTNMALRQSRRQKGLRSNLGTNLLGT